MFEEDTTYYIRVRGRVQGPFDLEQLKKLRQRGQFSRAHEVSSDQASWHSASILDVVFVAPKRAVLAKAKPAIEIAVETAGVGHAFQDRPTPSSPTEPTWHYTVGEEQYGPVTLVELRRLVAGGEVVETDLVWKVGMPQWTVVGDVSAINGTQGATPARNSQQRISSTQAFCFACGTSIDIRAELCPQCGVRQHFQTAVGKNRTTTALLALFLGGLGIHRFYLGGGANVVLGIIYILACWTLIPTIISCVEGIYFLCISDATFATSYGSNSMQ